MKIKYIRRFARAKKIRNVKRRQKQIETQVNSAQLCLKKDSWFNGWHHHLDQYSIGQESSKWRCFFIKQYFNLFNKYLEQIQESAFNCQCWVVIDLVDSGQDAVYIHSKNPYSDKYSAFPRKISLNKINIDKLPIELQRNIEDKYIFYHYSEGNFNSIWVETIEQSNSENSIKLKEVKNDYSNNQ